FERPGIAAENGYPRLQLQSVIGPQQRLQQPAAEEPGCAGDEDALAAQLIPQTLGARQAIVEIVAEQLGHTVQHKALPSDQRALVRAGIVGLMITSILQKPRRF